MFEHVTNDRVGTVLRCLRFLQGLSQLEIAEHIGCHREAVTMMEHGRQTIGVHTFVKWCHALELAPHDVLESILDEKMYAHYAAAVHATARV